MFGGSKKGARERREADAKEVTKKWGRQLRGEIRRLDREMRTIDRESAKMKAEIRKEAKRAAGKKTKALGIMARSLVQSNKHRTRLLESKVRVNSTVMALKQAEATAKVVGHMEANAAVMKSLGAMMSVSTVAKTAREMQKELAHAGVVEEMIDDSLAVLDSDDVEEAADEEVDNILNEILSGELGKAGVIKGANTVARAEAAEAEEVDAAEEKELEDMRARLARLDAS